MQSAYINDVIHRRYNGKQNITVKYSKVVRHHPFGGIVPWAWSKARQKTEKKREAHILRVCVCEREREIR